MFSQVLLDLNTFFDDFFFFFKKQLVFVCFHFRMLAVAVMHSVSDFLFFFKCCLVVFLQTVRMLILLSDVVCFGGLFLCVCVQTVTVKMLILFGLVVLDRFFFCLFECVQTVGMLILCVASRCFSCCCYF